MQPSEALQHLHPGVGPSGKGTKLGGAFAKEGRVAGSYAWSPFPVPLSPFATACALWTSSFWLRIEAPGTRIQGCLGQGRCDRTTQTAKPGVTLGLQTLLGHFRTLLPKTGEEGVVGCLKTIVLSWDFMYPSKY